MQRYAPHTYLGASDIQEEGNFVWVSTGQLLSYSNWAPSEPNDGLGEEDCVELEFYISKSKWFWNDMCCNCTNRPVVCEYWPCPVIMTASNGNIFRFTGHLCGEFTGHWGFPRIKASDTELYSERPRGAGFRSVNPAERWRENPARALARAGFSQHLECGIHRSESSPEGSFALIPRPVARWAKTTP